MLSRKTRRAQGKGAARQFVVPGLRQNFYESIMIEESRFVVEIHHQCSRPAIQDNLKY